MKRDDKHINKFLHEQLPEPEIQADDAWASMDNMLATGSVQESNGQSQLSNVWKGIARFKGLLIGASAVVTATVVALIILNTETKNQKHFEYQSINLNTQNSASARAGLEPSALKSRAERTGITATSPSETLPAKTPTPEAPTSEKAPSATTPPETTAPKTASVPGTVAATGPAGSNVAASNRAISGDNPPAGSSRIRTGAAHVPSTRSRDTHVLAGVHDTKPGAFSGNVIQHDDAFRPANRAISGQTTTDAVPAQISPGSLKSLPGHFGSMNNNLSDLVKKPALPNVPQPPVKSRNPIWQDIHFGPEWNINWPVASTGYTFAGADSIKHPLRLAIPGVFVSKNWNRHTATFIFNPLHSYFGDKERVAQRVDTIRLTDSLFHWAQHNTNFIKAFGVNFSLQYQYQAAPWFSLVGGLSYARYSAALLQRETVYSTSTAFDESHLTVKSREALQSYIRPQQWNIRAGVLFHSPGILNNRLQVACTATIPISNLSLKGFKSVKSPNIQLSLRFLVK